MPTYTINALLTGQTLSINIDASAPLSQLKSHITAQLTNPNNQTFNLFQNGRTITDLDSSTSISASGLQYAQPMLLLLNTGSGPSLQQSRQPQRPQQRAQGGGPASNEEIETLRNQMLNSAEMRAQLSQQSPQLADAINDPGRFRDLFRVAQDRMNNERNERERIMRELDANPEDPDNQRKILEMIQQGNIQAQMDQVLEEHPELLTQVTMLYVQLEVNGHPVKAFVDSGAQATILSPSCAEACNVTHLIDKRYSGIARGVGTAKILGRIHKAPVKIGYDDLPCSFTVMEGKDVDMLLGLDMLKRYQASIDLQANCLRFPGGQSLPFLPESEIPRFGGGGDDEPTVEGPDGKRIGAESGSVKPAGSGGNFGGQGRTIGGSGSAGSSSTGQVPAPAPAQPQSQPVSTPAPPAGGSGNFPQTSIDSLTALGASREHAIQALTMCEGDVERAASLVFDLMG